MKGGEVMGVKPIIITLQDKRQSGDPFWKDVDFIVTQLVNSTDYQIGQRLSKDEVSILIARPNWKVTLK